MNGIWTDFMFDILELSMFRTSQNSATIAFKKYLRISLLSKPENMINILFLFDFYRSKNSHVERLDRREKWI